MKYPFTVVGIALALNLASPTIINAAISASAPPVSLASNYHQNQIDLADYWVSEKLDGARAWWDGKQFLSRNGNVFNAPDWFIEGFPDLVLDGELWMGRGGFQSLMQTIRDSEPDDSAWRSVRFLAFDVPTVEGTFGQRQTRLANVVAEVASPMLKLVHQHRINSDQLLNRWLHQVVENGGEGLILQRDDQSYRSGRHSGMLKLKPHEDDEARVIAHIPGKGKYTGMTGSLLVVDRNGLQFRLGSGLSDPERRQPPALGSVVSYRFQGRTTSGKPRFARFLRVRPTE